MNNIYQVRSLIIDLVSTIGEFSSISLKRLPLDPPQNNNKSECNKQQDNIQQFPLEDLSKSMARVFLKLNDIAQSLSINLVTAIENKIKLNAKKYPADLVRGSTQKYTNYTAVTGISKQKGQSISSPDDTHHPMSLDYLLHSIDTLTTQIKAFATVREWSQFHQPRNLILAMVGELGEVSYLTFNTNILISTNLSIDFHVLYKACRVIPMEGRP